MRLPVPAKPPQPFLVGCGGTSTQRFRRPGDSHIVCPCAVLVEQTRIEAIRWLHKLGRLAPPLDLEEAFDPNNSEHLKKYRPDADWATAEQVSVVVLMGGEDAGEWDLSPEKPAIVIGTQDMLLSRALNRGYGMSRYRWPMHFGLLNNDCLWVLDEIQLMGVGLATSAQLQAFRQAFAPCGPVKTIWMSATLLPRWLETADYRESVPNLHRLQLTDGDYNAPGLRDRWHGEKTVEKAGASANEIHALAALVKDKHAPGSLTLVVVNRVDRSRDLFEELERLYQRGRPRGRGTKVTPEPETGGPRPDLKLIHSRYRSIERQAWMSWLKSPVPSEGRIVISTQIVEAGVDISAKALWTELAPWPSMVQRFGRCNRRGEFTSDDPAHIYWIDVPAKDDKASAPYTKEELDASRKHLRKLGDASLKSLHDLFMALADEDRRQLFPYDPPHVIRRKDFVDLFDTTPDLAGNDIDVSRFIREGDELDVQVFWRETEPPDDLDAKDARQVAPVRDELCPVPVAAFREFTEKGKAAFRWDALDGRWTRSGPDAIYAGQVFWVPREEGGYSTVLGWDPKALLPEELWLHTPQDTPCRTAEPEYDSDLLSVSRWRSIAEHTDEVMSELEAYSGGLEFNDIPWDAVRVAIRWHDWGKAHCIFQDAIKDDPVGDHQRPAERAGRRDIAKAAPNGFWRKYARKHFRHELASAMGVLTLLRQGKLPPGWADLSPQRRDLALYLIAAHHGKVRLSIRSLPEETRPSDPERLLARGLWHGDRLPGVLLGNEVTAPTVEELDLAPMQLGRCADGSPSWAERMLVLRDHPDIGPLRLAFLEAILRAADMRASMKADRRTRR